MYIGVHNDWRYNNIGENLSSLDLLKEVVNWENNAWRESERAS